MALSKGAQVNLQLLQEREVLEGVLRQLSDVVHADVPARHRRARLSGEDCPHASFCFPLLLWLGFCFFLLGFLGQGLTMEPSLASNSGRRPSCFSLLSTRVTGAQFFTPAEKP